MNRILLKALNDMQNVYATTRSVPLKELANEVLGCIDDSSTPTGRTGRPDPRLCSTSYACGLIDHDGPLEILDDPGSLDPYNTI